MTTKCTLSNYLHDGNPQDKRTLVTNQSDESLYILSVSANSSAVEIHELFPRAQWREGADELIYVYETYDEAAKGADDYIDSLPCGAL